MNPSNKEERIKLFRTPYASTVASLMFVVICARLDIAPAVGTASQFMANPMREHWNIVKRILRYIKGTLNVELCFRGSKFIIKGYVDSNFASDTNKRKSTRGYVFTLTGGAIGCVSKLQTIVALSTIETGCMATTHAYKEATWIKKLLEELGYK